MLFRNFSLKSLLIKHKRYFPYALFFIFLLCIIVATYKDYGIAWDENRFLSTGKYHLSNFLNLFGIETNLIDDTKSYYYFDIAGQTISHGVFFDVITIAVTLFFDTIHFETFHLIRGLFSVFTFIFLALIVQRLNIRRWALVGLFFLLLSPRFYGNMLISPIDIPTALFFTATVCAFIYYLRSSQSIFQTVMLGLITGLLINQRLLMVYVFGMQIFILLIQEYYLSTKKWKLLFMRLVIYCISTIFFMHLVNPHLLTQPIVGIYDMIVLNSKFPFNATVFFDGQIIHASQLPWYYLPKYILITTPLSIMALFFVGTFQLLNRIRLQDKRQFDRLIAIYFLLLFFSPFLINIIIKPILYDSWRFFLFLTIPLVIIALYGLEPILRLKYKKIKILIVLFIFLNILSTAYQMVVLHPYQYVYFNGLVGGLLGASKNYETDYWALGNREAVLWFNEYINKPYKQYTIMVEGDPFSASYYFNKNMFLTYELSKADYYITFTRWNKHKNISGNVVYMVTRQSVPLIFIYKMDK